MAVRKILTKAALAIKLAVLCVCVCVCVCVSVTLDVSVKGQVFLFLYNQALKNHPLIFRLIPLKLLVRITSTSVCMCETMPVISALQQGLK